MSILVEGRRASLGMPPPVEGKEETSPNPAPSPSASSPVSESLTTTTDHRVDDGFVQDTLQAPVIRSSAGIEVNRTSSSAPTGAVDHTTMATTAATTTSAPVLVFPALPSLPNEPKQDPLLVAAPRKDETEQKAPPPIREEKGTRLFAIRVLVTILGEKDGDAIGSSFTADVLHDKEIGEQERTGMEKPPPSAGPVEDKPRGAGTLSLMILQDGTSFPRTTSSLPTGFHEVPNAVYTVVTTSTTMPSVTSQKKKGFLSNRGDEPLWNGRYFRHHTPADHPWSSFVFSIMPFPYTRGVSSLQGDDKLAPHRADVCIGVDVLSKASIKDLWEAMEAFLQPYFPPEAWGAASGVPSPSPPASTSSSFSFSVYRKLCASVSSLREHLPLHYGKEKKAVRGAFFLDEQILPWDLEVSALPPDSVVRLYYGEAARRRGVEGVRWSSQERIAPHVGHQQQEEKEKENGRAALPAVEMEKQEKTYPVVAAGTTPYPACNSVGSESVRSSSSFSPPSLPSSSASAPRVVWIVEESPRSPPSIPTSILQPGAHTGFPATATTTTQKSLRWNLCPSASSSPGTTEAFSIAGRAFKEESDESPSRRRRTSISSSSSTTGGGVGWDWGGPTPYSPSHFSSQSAGHASLISPVRSVPSGLPAYPAPHGLPLSLLSGSPALFSSFPTSRLSPSLCPHQTPSLPVFVPPSSPAFSSSVPYSPAGASSLPALSPPPPSRFPSSHPYNTRPKGGEEDEAEAAAAAAARRTHLFYEGEAATGGVAGSGGPDTQRTTPFLTPPFSEFAMTWEGQRSWMERQRVSSGGPVSPPPPPLGLSYYYLPASRSRDGSRVSPTSTTTQLEERQRSGGEQRSHPLLLGGGVSAASLSSAPHMMWPTPMPPMSPGFGAQDGGRGGSGGVQSEVGGGAFAWYYVPIRQTSDFPFPPPLSTSSSASSFFAPLTGSALASPYASMGSLPMPWGGVTEAAGGGGGSNAVGREGMGERKGMEMESTTPPFPPSPSSFGMPPGYAVRMSASTPAVSGMAAAAACTAGGGPLYASTGMMERGRSGAGSILSPVLLPPLSASATSFSYPIPSTEVFPPVPTSPSSFGSITRGSGRKGSPLTLPNLSPSPNMFLASPWGERDSFSHGSLHEFTHAGPRGPTMTPPRPPSSTWTTGMEPESAQGYDLFPPPPPLSGEMGKTVWPPSGATTISPALPHRSERNRIVEQADMKTAPTLPYSEGKEKTGFPPPRPRPSSPYPTPPTSSPSSPLYSSSRRAKLTAWECQPPSLVSGGGTSPTTATRQIATMAEYPEGTEKGHTMLHRTTTTTTKASSRMPPDLALQPNLLTVPEESMMLRREEAFSPLCNSVHTPSNQFVHFPDYHVPPPRPFSSSFGTYVNDPLQPPFLSDGARPPSRSRSHSDSGFSPERLLYTGKGKGYKENSEQEKGEEGHQRKKNKTKKTAGKQASHGKEEDPDSSPERREGEAAHTSAFLHGCRSESKRSSSHSSSSSSHGTSTYTESDSLELQKVGKKLDLDAMSESSLQHPEVVVTARPTATPVVVPLSTQSTPTKEEKPVKKETTRTSPSSNPPTKISNNMEKMPDMVNQKKEKETTHREKKEIKKAGNTATTSTFTSITTTTPVVKARMSCKEEEEKETQKKQIEKTPITGSPLTEGAENEEADGTDASSFLFLHIQLPEDVDKEWVCGIGNSDTTILTVGGGDRSMRGPPEDGISCSSSSVSSSVPTTTTMNTGATTTAAGGGAAAVAAILTPSFRRLRVRVDSPIAALRALLNIPPACEVWIQGRVVVDEHDTFGDLQVSNNAMVSFAATREGDGVRKGWSPTSSSSWWWAPRRAGGKVGSGGCREAAYKEKKIVVPTAFLTSVHAPEVRLLPPPPPPSPGFTSLSFAVTDASGYSSLPTSPKNDKRERKETTPASPMTSIRLVTRRQLGTTRLAETTAEGAATATATPLPTATTTTTTMTTKPLTPRGVQIALKVGKEEDASASPAPIHTTLTCTARTPASLLSESSCSYSSSSSSSCLQFPSSFHEEGEAHRYSALGIIRRSLGDTRKGVPRSSSSASSPPQDEEEETKEIDVVDRDHQKKETAKIKDTPQGTTPSVVPPHGRSTSTVGPAGAGRGGRQPPSSSPTSSSSSSVSSSSSRQSPPPVREGPRALSGEGSGSHPLSDDPAEKGTGKFRSPPTSMLTTDGGEVLSGSSFSSSFSVTSAVKSGDILHLKEGSCSNVLSSASLKRREVEQEKSLRRVRVKRGGHAEVLMVNSLDEEEKKEAAKENNEDESIIADGVKVAISRRQREATVRNTFF